MTSKRHIIHPFVKWTWLSENSSAIHLLEQNIDKINWTALSRNPNAIHILEQNVDKIDWFWLKISDIIQTASLKHNSCDLIWIYIGSRTSIFKITTSIFYHLIWNHH